jgi:hypothetical protein
MVSGVDRQRLGPYRITGLLGAGGMGRVYRAIKDGSSAEVALKVMATGGQPHGEDRFLTEAESLAAIDHPHIIRCLDYGNADGDLYMALELMEGGDAKGLLKRRKVDELRALRIIRDCARGLEAIEVEGLIHRDIKPDNIFLDGDGGAKLADFGIVRRVDLTVGLTMPGMPIGTVAYMAPEQAQATERLDIRTDIHALGASLFCLLSGRPPYIGDNPMLTMLMIVSDPPPDLKELRDDLSPQTLAAVQRMLAKDRDDRYQHPIDLVAALDQAIEVLVEAKGAARSDGARKVLGDGAAEPVSSSHKSGLRFDPDTLKRVMKRIRVAGDGLSAWINLAPSARFPKALLDAVLEEKSITYGLIPGAILDASRASADPRRVIVARGDLPSPGFGGRDVYGQDVPPLATAVAVTVDDDGMTARALVDPRAGVPPRPAVEAISHLWSRPVTSGSMVIARGTTMEPPRMPGFHLAAADASASAVLPGNLIPVHAGETIAHWDDGAEGRPGMDVYGIAIPCSQRPELDPDSQAGEGTDLTRDRQGRLCLRATIDGHCQQRIDGTVRVVQVHEVPGDLGAGADSIDSDAVVLVRGSVLAGAQITCGADVIIEGDLYDAVIEAGGSIEVKGDVRQGAAPVRSADGVEVAGNVLRRIVAGSLRIDGLVENCEVQASGDIECRQVIGGALIAGGSVLVQRAGHPEVVSTGLWAGHNLPYNDQQKLAALAERRMSSERARLVGEVQRLAGSLKGHRARGSRIAGSDWVNDQALSRHQGMVQRLEEQAAAMELASEDARMRLAEQRGLLRELDGLTNNSDAVVQASVIAHPGVVARLADSDPTTLSKPVHRFRLSLDHG